MVAALADCQEALAAAATLPTPGVPGRFGSALTTPPPVLPPLDGTDKTSLPVAGTGAQEDNALSAQPPRPPLPLQTPPTVSCPASEATPPRPPDATPSSPFRWAALLARIYEVFPLICPTCQGPLDGGARFIPYPSVEGTRFHGLGAGRHHPHHEQGKEKEESGPLEESSHILSWNTPSPTGDPPSVPRRPPAPLPRGGIGVRSAYTPG